MKSYDQDCEMFNFKKAFGDINNVFANPKEICLLYGDCYYRSPQKDNETGICMNKKDVSCYDYTKEDCVGPENRSVSVDVDCGAGDSNCCGTGPGHFKHGSHRKARSAMAMILNL